ncbi:AGE family epimerase/isomerase [Neolewinella antarctica]|uniref:Cellobiose 2-epimerase n=1 Tax=Neolewinella antarctica TaxID=442734 RepID=A0ABX0XGA1_9BACT|nr:AGE family epimerase/isomerase [Neolewinella antarctica]NJC28237.1 mannobiose 2-epimerase [Neolewinella antarctica]
MQTELNELLSWWVEHMVDKENGGFYGRMDGQGTLHKNADKAVILHTRLLWTFATAAVQTGSEEHRRWANYLWEYCSENFIDQVNGGVFWMLDAEGNPINTRKQIYAQAFAIYAFAAYYELTKDEEALRQAMEIFWLIERYSIDKTEGGYIEAFDHFWRPIDDMRLSDKDQNTAKTMNTHLHVLEAYTLLCKVNPLPVVKEALTDLVNYFIDRFIDPNTHHLHLFFDKHWNVQSDEVSFGHDIECSWLLWEAAEVSGDEALIEKVKRVSVQMARVTLEEGLDEDGSLFNERFANGHFDTDKHWWPQAEAVVGFYNAGVLSGNQAYITAAFDCWAFIKQHLKRGEQGEWHWRVDQQLVPGLTDDVGGPWKTPYHNGRMCMEMATRLK